MTWFRAGLLILFAALVVTVTIKLGPYVESAQDIERLVEQVAELSEANRQLSEANQDLNRLTLETARTIDAAATTRSQELQNQLIRIERQLARIGRTRTPAWPTPLQGANLPEMPAEAPPPAAVEPAREPEKPTPLLCILTLCV